LEATRNNQVIDEMQKGFEQLKSEYIEPTMEGVQLKLDDLNQYMDNLKLQNEEDGREI
jgi:hypothetical protein